MNARDSLAADREAEEAYHAMIVGVGDATVTDSQVVACALVCIAAELRAARVYANYLEGRQGARVSAKLDRDVIDRIERRMQQQGES